jgi:diguanylate cyclase (GGDEF)-like protein
MLSASTRLKALDVREERLLAGRVAGLMYLIAAGTAVLLLPLPGAETGHWQVVLGLAAIALAWGLVCLLVLEWDRIPPLVSHFSCSLGLPMIAVMMTATGGATSPARFYLFFIVVYCSYFYRAREAIPYFAGCLAVDAIPLFYDRAAVSNGLVGELVVLAPTIAILGGLILAGKRLLLELRDDARELSLHDPRTELANRRALMNLLDAHVQVAGGADQRAADSLGLLLVGLDHFKSANTVYGYLGGDRVLCEAANALTSAARQGDVVARLGGDEFAIACPGMNDEALEHLSQRVLEALDERGKALVEMPEFAMTASVGAALFPRDASNSEDLIAAADRCMRAAKSAGRNRAVNPATIAA